jgi:hypothetical protein
MYDRHYHLIRVATDRPRERVLDTCQHEIVHYELDHKNPSLSLVEEHEIITEEYKDGEILPWQVGPVC